ncbi:MAG: LamG domain-containing protein, partial [Betaproteobacteria bacterium]|nr:LamG domain-containing protein [Betaproteobacteria bacterium]
LFFANGLAAPFTHVANTPSAEQGLPITGVNLIGPTTVTPSAGYEVCTTANGTYQSAPLTVVPVNGTLNATIYVRIAAATAQASPAGVLTVTSPGLPDRQILLNQGEMHAGLFNSGFFNIPTISGSQLSGDITVEAWIWINAYANYARILDIGNSSGQDNILFTQEGTSGRIYFEVFGGANGTTSANVKSPNAIPTGTWTHVAGVMEANGNMKLYINGALVASNNQTAITAREATRFNNFIGKSNWSGDALWNGRITDVRIWNVARTQAEIQAAMAIGAISGPALGLTAAYPMGSSGQAPLDDVSGNNYNLTQNGNMEYIKDNGATGVSQSLTLGETISGTSTLWLGQNSLILPECWYEVPASAQIGGDFTVEGWVNISSYADNFRFFDFGNGVGNGGGASYVHLAPYASSSDTRGYFNVMGSNGTNYQVRFPAPPLNTWTHIAAVLESNGTMRVYINGVEAGNTTGVNLPASIPRTRSYLGKSNWANDPLFRGSMRDIRIWDTARTAAQIQLGMTVGSITGAQTGLVACYPTGLNGDPYLNDTSGNGNHLVQQGQTTFVENAIFFPGSNTHTGNTNLGDTALALGSGSLRFYNNSTFRYTGTGAETTSRALWGDTGGATGTFDIVNAQANLIFNATGGTYNQTFVKTGAGTLTYSNTVQQLTGDVIVLGGKLALGGTDNRIYGGRLFVTNATVEVITSNHEQTIRGNLFLNGGTLAAAAGVTPDGNYGHFNMDDNGVSVNVSGDATSVIAANLNMRGWHDFNVANGAAAIDLDVTGRLSNHDGIEWGMFNKYGDGTMRIRAGGNNTAGTYIRGGEVIFGAGGLGQGISGQAYKVDFYNAPTLTWDAGNTEDITAAANSGMGMYLEDGATPTLNVGTNNVTFANTINAGVSGTGETRTKS